MFYDRNNQLIKPNDLEVGLITDSNSRSVKSISFHSGLSDFEIYFTPPNGVSKALIEFDCKGGQSVQLVSNAYVRRIKKREKNISNILNKTFDFFQSKKNLSFEEVSDFTKKQAEQFGKDVVYLAEIIFDQTRYKYEYLARYFGQVVLGYRPSEWMSSRVYNSFHFSGSIAKRNVILSDVKDQPWISSFPLRITKAQEEERLLLNGYKFDVNVQSRYEPEKNALYLLHNSLPYNSGGYASRTHGLIKNITRHSPFTVRALARPGFPTDYQRHISKRLPDVIPEVSVIDKIEYLVGNQEVDKRRLTFQQYIQEFSDDIIGKAQRFKTSIIHAASNYPNGLAAIQAAKSLGIKSVYEVRGLWEITRLSRQHFWKSTDQYQMTAQLESQALQEADVGIVITKALKDLMESRGVSKTLHVVPNAVDIDAFSPQDKNAELMAQLKISNEVVIGYVGSVVEYEGLDDLLAACRDLKVKHRKQFKLLIVGDGAALSSLKLLQKVYDLKEEVVFTGRVPHSEVSKYISIIDIMPFPRKPYMVCEIVSPLKPFESLACRKAVLVSSCAALTEIIKHDETGLVFEKADLDDLTQKLVTLIDKPDLRNRIADAGYNWVRANRSWKTVSQIASDLYADLYEQILAERNSH